MNQSKLTSFCPVRNYHHKSLEDYLKDDLKFSKSIIKKFLSKKQRELILKGESYDLPLDLFNLGMVNPDFSMTEIEIIHEDETLVILNKPAGLHSFPQSYSESNTCLNFLRKKSIKMPYKDNSNLEQGLLYRLDYETSGVLIFVKDKKLHQDLRLNFNEIVELKEYFAVVEGKFDSDGSHVHFLGSQGPRGKVVTFSNDYDEQHPQEAIASFSLQSYNKDEDVSLVKVQLSTGLRHQIRVQLKALGHPIIGDQLYGGKSHERLYLHAFRYKLLIENKMVEFESEPSFDLFF